MFKLNISPRFEQVVSVPQLEALRQLAQSAVASASRLRFGTGAKSALGVAAVLSLSLVAVKSNLAGGHPRDGNAPVAATDMAASQQAKPAVPAPPMTAVVADNRINLNGIDPKPTGTIRPVPVAEPGAGGTLAAKHRHRTVRHPAKPRRVAVVQGKAAKDRKPPAH